MREIQHLLVAPGSRVAGKAAFQADRPAVRRAGLDDIWPLGGKNRGGFCARPDNGDMAGFVVVVVVIGGHHEFAGIGGGLRLDRPRQGLPSRLLTLIGLQPFVLGVRQQYLTMLGGPKNIDAKTLGHGRGKGTAMSVLAG